MDTMIKMLLPTLLSAMGYTRENFDTLIKRAETEFSAVKAKAAEYDARLTEIEKSIARIEAVNIINNDESEG